jgi:hypothetical protein
MRNDKQARITALEESLASGLERPQIIRYIVEPSPGGPRTIGARRPDGKTIDRRQDEAEGRFRARAMRELYGTEASEK